MKQHLRIFMALLVFMICGGVSFGQTFKKVTSETELKAGDVIAIVNESAKVALSTTQNTHNRGKKEITLSNGEFSWVSGVQEISLEGESGKWSFNVGDGYLYAAGSSTKSENYLQTQQTIDANAQASISFSGGNATIKFSSATTRNTIKYNSSSKLFACYANGQQLVQIYKKEIQDGKTSTALSFGIDYDGKTITKNVGDIFEAPATLTPAIEGATITYKSSDATVAEVVDGTVAAKKEGTATITASYAGNDTYRASSASYTIQVEKIETTLSFPTASYTFTEGDEGGATAIDNNYAILSPSEAGTVSYSVSGTEGLVEMDNGYVLVNTNNVGTATITASFAGNDKYLAAEATYTITVNKKPGEVEDGVFDFTDGTIDYGSGLTPRKDYNQTEYDGETKWVAGNVVINTTGQTRWWATSSANELRFYSGSSFVVSAPNGYLITSLKLTGAYSFKVDRGTYNSNNGKWNGYADAITFSYNASKGNIAVKTITVTYTKIESLTTAASGFATYAADYAVNYTEAGLKAYAVKVSDDKTKVSYTECTGVVPTGKAVLVKGEANNEYTLTPATEDADATFATDLQISDGTVTADGTTIFAFGTKNNVSGFKIVKSGVVIPEKKGYLVVANASAAKDFFAFDDSTNGIDDPTIEIGEEEVPLFNLAGQRVGKDYKGIVVKNGKKYVNK